MTDGTILRFGYTPPAANHDFGGCGKFAAQPGMAILDPSQWRETDLGIDQVPVFYQTQNGCVGHGGTTAFWLAYNMAGGTVPPSGFSPTSLYAMVNNGIDEGAIVSDSMQALMDFGVCTMDEFPEAKYFEPQLSAQAKETRKRFRVQDAYHCDTFEAIGSALQLGFPVSFGVTLPYGYQSVGPDGLMPLARFDPRAGHCMCGYGTTKLKSGEPAIKVRNSWSSRWGNQGNCLMVAYHFGRQCDAFAVRADITDPLDPNAQPVAP